MSRPRNWRVLHPVATSWHPGAIALELSPDLAALLHDTLFAAAQRCPLGIELNAAWVALGEAIGAAEDAADDEPAEARCFFCRQWGELCECDGGPQ